MTNEQKQRLAQFLENRKESGKYTAFEFFIFGVILLNAVVIYMQVSGYESSVLVGIDMFCTLVFVLEMVLKHIAFGVKGYWSEGWNKLDGTLVVLSFPSLLTPFVPIIGGNLSILLILRLLRVLKFFKVMKFFPNFTSITKGFKKAMKETWAVLAAFVVIILIFALINCSLFKDAAPDYFGTPMLAFYSVFRLFTVEGWYDIPDAVASGMGLTAAPWLRFYFSILLILGGILGMSLINSIFVDAMAEDNNDDVKEQLKEMERKIDMLVAQQNGSNEDK